MKNVCAISLSLVLLLAVGTGGMVTTPRNKCKCENIPVSSTIIPLRYVTNFEVFPVGPFCNKLEYIVTLKRFGKQRCLDPTSGKVQEMYEQYLASKKSQNNQPRRRRPIRPQ